MTDLMTRAELKRLSILLNKYRKHCERVDWIAGYRDRENDLEREISNVRIVIENDLTLGVHRPEFPSNFNR